jgi:hypothetical protein
MAHSNSKIVGYSEAIVGWRNIATALILPETKVASCSGWGLSELL